MSYMPELNSKTYKVSEDVIFASPARSKFDGILGVIRILENVAYVKSVNYMSDGFLYVTVLPEVTDETFANDLAVLFSIGDAELQEVKRLDELMDESPAIMTADDITEAVSRIYAFFYAKENRDMLPLFLSWRDNGLQVFSHREPTSRERYRVIHNLFRKMKLGKSKPFEQAYQDHVREIEEENAKAMLTKEQSDRWLAFFHEKLAEYHGRRGLGWYYTRILSQQQLSSLI